MCYVTYNVAEKYRRPHLSRGFPPNCAVSLAVAVAALHRPCICYQVLSHLWGNCSTFLYRYQVGSAFLVPGEILFLLVRFDCGFRLRLPTNTSKWHSLQARRNGVGLRKGTLGHARACGQGRTHFDSGRDVKWPWPY